MKFFSILVMCVHFSHFQFVRKTGSKSKKQSMKKNRGVGWGYMIQNQTSPDFSFPERGISALVVSNNFSIIIPYKHIQL